MDGYLAPARGRLNFRIDLFSAVCSGLCMSVLVTFMHVVVRRLGGSAGEVALVVAAPFIGHLLAPVFAYLLSGIPVARVVFFFQAEDGIRDDLVTGVQTCALPI